MFDIIAGQGALQQNSLTTLVLLCPEKIVHRLRR